MNRTSTTEKTRQNGFDDNVKGYGPEFMEFARQEKSCFHGHKKNNRKKF